MPCNSDGFPRESDNYRELKASMCAILSFIEDSEDLNRFLNTLNWEEAGVSKQWLVSWWEEHKRQDKERRQREYEAKIKHQTKINAIKKLTPDEIIALGIKI